MVIQPTDNRTKKTVIPTFEIFRGHSPRERTLEDVSCQYARSATREKICHARANTEDVGLARDDRRSSEISFAATASHKGRDHLTALRGSRTRNQGRSKLGASSGEGFMQQEEVTSSHNRRDSANNESSDPTKCGTLSIPPLCTKGIPLTMYHTSETHLVGA